MTLVRMIQAVESATNRVLAVALSLVIISATLNLCLFVAQQFLQPPYGIISVSLLEIFGSLLDILIALELLENILSYLREHKIQVDLVLATALIAVARKFIVLDLPNTPGDKLIGLALAIVALTICYRLVQRRNVP